MSVENDHKEKQSKRFGKLPEDWRTDMMQKSTEEVFKTITDRAMHVVQLTMEQELDEDLKSLKQQASDAGKRYSDGKKAALLGIEFLCEVLAAKGVDVPSLADLMKTAKKSDDDSDDE